MPVDPTAASESLRVAILGAVAPYREGISSALRESGFEPVSENNRDSWLKDRRRRGLIGLIGGGFRWFDIEAFTCMTEVTTIALVPEIRVDQYMKALRLGCHGVVHSDTSAQIIVSVFEAALRGEVVLPREAARVMARNNRSDPWLFGP